MNGTYIWVVNITETKVMRYAVEAKTRKQAKDLAKKFKNGFCEPDSISRSEDISANRTDYPHHYKITQSNDGKAGE